jgi:hypothetical protein
MPTIEEMFPKRHIAVEDLQGKPWTLEIARVCQEKVFLPRKNQTAQKWVIYFKGAQKFFILNKTTAEQTAMVTGSQASENWIGKKICIFPDPGVHFGSEIFTAIRVRKPANGVDAPPATMHDDADDEV